MHSRDKKMDPNLDYHRIARATAGFTGAELMNLMNQAAITAVRQSRDIITEDELFQVCGIWVEPEGLFVGFLI